MKAILEEMNQVAVKILEDWALMLVEPADDWKDEFDPEGLYFVGRLQFRGVVCGTYAVICQESFARCLAANLLGGEDDINDGQMQDAVSEMTNVLSGNLLTSTYGEDTVFDLSSPTVAVMKHQEVGEIMTGTTLCYRADDNPVAVGFIPERIQHGD